MATIRSLMNAVLHEQNTWQQLLLHNWATIVGPLHTKICLERIQDTTVIIGVHDVHWMHELHCLSRELITTINEHLGKPHVTKVRLVLSNTQHSTRTKKRATQPQRTISAPVQESAAAPLTPSQQKALSAIEDEQLQQLLQDLIQRRSS